MKIGFIGLGNVGGKLAGSLFRNRFDLTVYDLDKNVTDKFKLKGIKIKNSISEIVKEVDVVITCLPSPKICSDVMLSENGILKNISKEQIDDAYNTISSWQGYSPTPLLQLNKLLFAKVGFLVERLKKGK